jgi:GAF domain
MQSEVIRTGKPLIENDVGGRVAGEEGGTFYDVDREGTVRKLPDTGPTHVQAAMMVPIKDAGRVVGVVQLMSDERTYTEDDLELVEGLVGLMAGAVRMARLETERRRAEASEAAAQAVAAEREQAARLLEAVGDGIFYVRRDGVVRLWNRSAANPGLRYPGSARIATARASRARRRAARSGSGVRARAVASTTSAAVSASVRHAAWAANGRVPARVRTQYPTLPRRRSGLRPPRSSAGHSASATSGRCVTPTVGRFSTAPRWKARPAPRA